ncbi:MAG: type II secretion system F family protein [Phycisphaerae bacterium]
MNLTFEAIDTAGRTVNNVIQAESARAAVEQLRQKGLMVTSIDQAQPNRVEQQADATALDESKLRLPLKQLVLFTRQMAMLLTSGSAVAPALNAIARQMGNPAHRALVRRLREDLEEGNTLAEALCRFSSTFDPSYCAVIAAGESSATLGSMFQRMSGVVGSRRVIRKKVLGAMAYPALLMMLCISQINVLLFFVLPRFGEMFATLGAPLPTSTKMMLALSESLLAYWPAVLAAAVAVVVGLVLLVGTAVGRQWIADIQIRIPMMGRLFSGLIQGQAFRTLGMLLEARVAVLESLELARRSTANNRFQALFDSMEEAVTSGGSLSDSLERSGLIAPAMCQAVRTGEESGNLGTAMTYVADVLDEDNAELVTTLTKLMEPAIIILMGVVVGGVAISLFLPMFDITSMTQQ